MLRQKHEFMMYRRRTARNNTETGNNCIDTGEITEEDKQWNIYGI